MLSKGFRPSWKYLIMSKRFHLRISIISNGKPNQPMLYDEDNQNFYKYDYKYNNFQELTLIYVFCMTCIVNYKDKKWLPFKEFTKCILKKRNQRKENPICNQLPHVEIGICLNCPNRSTSVKHQMHLTLWRTAKNKLDLSTAKLKESSQLPTLNLSNTERYLQRVPQSKWGPEFNQNTKMWLASTCMVSYNLYKQNPKIERRKNHFFKLKWQD